MFGNYLEALLRATSAATVTEVFIWVMLGIFGIALALGLLRRQHSSFVDYAPSVLVSVGILGTFIGIVIGLLNFDPHDIKASIEGLLDGLKTAFITSLVGVSLSIILKVLDSVLFTNIRKQGSQPDEVTAESIYGVMKQQELLLQGISQSLSGHEEGSVAGQLRLLRTDINDFRSGLNRQHEAFQTSLFERLQQFGDMLAQSATETVINALREVIQDFNRHLVEQFGDNFKALNEAVHKMVSWQDQYKEHVEQLENRLETAIRELERTATANEAISHALGLSEQSITNIEGHCQSIPAAIAQLEPVLQTNQHQISELDRHLETFVKMREHAVRAVPELQSHMTSLSEQLSTQMGQVMTTMHEGALEFGQSADRVNAALTETSHVVSTSTEKINQNMTDASKDFNNSVRDTLEVMQRHTQDLEQNMGQIVEQVSRGLEEQFRRITDQLHERMSGTIDSTMETLRTTVEQNLNQTQQAITNSSDRTLQAVEQQVRSATEQARDSLHAQLTAMDSAIARELELVFREMGSALATISRRIADDHAEFSRRTAEA